jgi:hypothetical protein
MLSRRDLSLTKTPNLLGAGRVHQPQEAEREETPGLPVGSDGSGVSSPAFRPHG